MRGRGLRRKTARVLACAAAGLLLGWASQSQAKPVEYVKVCSLYGAGFYYLPGTDTCIRLGPRAERTFQTQPVPTNVFRPSNPPQSAACQSNFGAGFYFVPGTNTCINLNYNLFSNSGTYQTATLPRNWRQTLAADARAQAGSGTPPGFVRYDSPTVAGFVVRGTVPDDYWGAALRYAGEFSGFRIAAGAGYARHSGDTVYHGEGFGASGNSSGICGDLYVETPFLVHVPSGLFVSGGVAGSVCSGVTFGGIHPTNHENHITRIDSLATLGGRLSVTKHWTVQGGVSQNWFGIRSTSLYGEYGVASGKVEISAGGHVAANETQSGSYWGIGVSATLPFWGVSGVQNIDSAALELYLAYRRVDLGSANADFGVIVPTSTEIDIVSSGARIKF